MRHQTAFGLVTRLPCSMSMLAQARLRLTLVLQLTQGNAGATMLLFANGNSSNGTATYSAIYAIQFYYDGNNTGDPKDC